MNIFNKIKNSIYNPEYYKEVLLKPFSYSFKYLLVFALLFALVFTVVLSVKFAPMVNFLWQKTPELTNRFPQELTVTIKDGEASSNVQEPYFIEVPQDWKNEQIANSDADSIDNIIVINTKDKFDISSFTTYKTFAILSQDSIAYLDENGKISIQPLSNIEDLTLNRSTIVSFIDRIKPFLFVIIPFIIAGIYVAGFISVLIQMVYLLFGALLIWLIAKIKGIKLGYKKSYIVGMQLMTGAIIITSILSTFSIKIPIPFLFSILLIISAVINLKKDAVPANTPALTA